MVMYIKKIPILTRRKELVADSVALSIVPQMPATLAPGQLLLQH